MVLPEVQHWELVVSYGPQTLCECHKRGWGAADLDSGENQHSGDGHEEPILAGGMLVERSSSGTRQKRI